MQHGSEQAEPAGLYFGEALGPDEGAPEEDPRGRVRTGDASDVRAGRGSCQGGRWCELLSRAERLQKTMPCLQDRRLPRHRHGPLDMSTRAISCASHLLHPQNRALEAFLPPRLTLTQSCSALLMTSSFTEPWEPEGKRDHPWPSLFQLRTAA